MKTPELIALGLAGVALYLIVKRGGSAAVNPANGKIPKLPTYWTSDFGSEAWSQSLNDAAAARLKRQGGA